MKRLETFEKGVDAILDGHADLRRMRLKEACADYLRAQAICPDDAAVQFSLTFDDLERRLQHDPLDAWALVTKGDIETVKKNYSVAADFYYQAIDAAQAPMRQSQGMLARAAQGLAQCYRELGRPDRAADIERKYREER